MTIPAQKEQLRNEIKWLETLMAECASDDRWQDFKEAKRRHEVAYGHLEILIQSETKRRVVALPY
jgi:hypothetical protein